MSGAVGESWRAREAIAAPAADCVDGLTRGLPEEMRNRIEAVLKNEPTW